ncbi:MAG: hypothetical protein A2Z93_12435 [Curvibacter sp. GWA2_64_110]|nr:MAG: hypothetical protein A2Z93_12435 [Curvibacter sp. GWA2_64_110]HCY14652.1 hypothetical protein [Curvibacter sp.]
MKIAILGAPGSGKTWLAQALQQHRPELQISDNPPIATLPSSRVDRILLTGLDLPGITPTQQETDSALRAALQQAGLAYGVVYGQGAQRLAQALRLITPEDGPAPRWTGLCEKCADPDCEFRLFTGLKGLKAAGRPAS